MTTEVKTYKLQIDADPRLTAGAGGLARFLGEAAGLTSEAAAQLQESVVATCEEGFRNSGDQAAHLTLKFSLYTDRIEVAVAHAGSLEPAIGLDRIAGFAAHVGSGAMSGVDRVQYETKEGTAVTRLTKYLRPAPRMA